MPENGACYPQGMDLIHLCEALLRLLRSELGGFAVPGPGGLGVGRGAAHVGCAEHGGIVGLRQQERSLGLMGAGGALEQQSRTREIAGIEQALRSLQEPCEFIGVETPYGGRRWR